MVRGGKQGTEKNSISSSIYGIKKELNSHKLTIDGWLSVLGESFNWERDTSEEYKVSIRY